MSSEQFDSTNQLVDDDDDEEVSSTNKRSIVWEYFHKLPIGPNGELKSSCKACGKTYDAKPQSGTSSMKRHIPKCFDCLRKHLKLNKVLVCDGDFIHVRCGAHVLNLIVQAGLQVIEEAIYKIRESVKYVRGSAARKLKFAECISHLSLKCGKHVRHDVITRWNSTYLMLNSALVYRRAYARSQLVDSNFKTCPSEDEWSRVEKIIRFLKPFYDITTLFSGSSYPTANLYFHNIWKIQMLIEEEICSEDPLISGMAKEMKAKFDKYWESYSMILSFAVVLDPRYKLKIIEYCFSKLKMDTTAYIEKVNSVREGLFKLYEEYKIHSNIGHGSSTSSSNVMGYEDVEDELEGFESFQSLFDGSHLNKSQLDMYLAEPVFDRKQQIDVLQYWKENQGRFPELALMARDVLSIPITTVASESSFSVGGRIISKYRCSLLPSNAEALLCARDWLFGLKDLFKTMTTQIYIYIERKMMFMIMIAALVQSITTPIVSFRRKLLNYHEHEHGRQNAAMIEVQELSDDKVDRIDCIVCLSDVAAGQKYAKLLRCKHRFHVECVEAWLKDHSTCPLCRTSVSNIPEDDDINIHSNIYLKKLYETMSCYYVSALQSLASWLSDPITRDLQYTLSESCNYL